MKTHTCIHTDLLTYILAYIHTLSQTHTHTTYIHTCMQLKRQHLRPSPKLCNQAGVRQKQQACAPSVVGSSSVLSLQVMLHGESWVRSNFRSKTGKKIERATGLDPFTNLKPVYRHPHPERKRQGRGPSKLETSFTLRRLCLPQSCT